MGHISPGGQDECTEMVTVQERERIAELIQSIVLCSDKMDAPTAWRLGLAARLIADGRLSRKHKCVRATSLRDMAGFCFDETDRETP